MSFYRPRGDKIGTGNLCRPESGRRTPLPPAFHLRGRRTSRILAGKEDLEDYPVRLDEIHAIAPQIPAKPSDADVSSELRSRERSDRAFLE